MTVSHTKIKLKVKQCSAVIKSRIRLHYPSLHLKPYHYHLLDTTILMETCSMIRKSKCSLPALAKELGYYACTAQVHIVCLSVDSNGTRCFPSPRRPIYSHLKYRTENQNWHHDMLSVNSPGDSFLKPTCLLNFLILSDQ